MKHDIKDLRTGKIIAVSINNVSMWCELHGYLPHHESTNKKVFIVISKKH